jgi:hypothetical protein
MDPGEDPAQGRFRSIENLGEGPFYPGRTSEVTWKSK